MTSSERFILEVFGLTVVSFVAAVAIGELLVLALSAMSYVLNAVFDMRWPSINGLTTYWTTSQKLQALIVVMPFFVVGMFAWAFVKSPEGQRIMGRIVRIIIWPRTENEKSSAVVRLGRVWHWLAALIAAGAFGIGCILAWHIPDGWQAILVGAVACLLILLIGRAGRYILSNE